MSMGAHRSLERTQAALRRLESRHPSTRATTSSTASERMHFCAAMVFTRRSTRSILGAPAARARAAEDWLPSDCAAAAYFSNGTRSFSEAPRDVHSLAIQL